MHYENTLSFAQSLDAQDPLRSYRDRFHIPQRNGQDLIYLCGNSLGLQPKAARLALDGELNTWQHLGVEGWFDSLEEGVPSWLSYHQRCQEPLAQIVGAQPLEVCPMNALTVNLHLLMASFYRPQGAKTQILTIAGDFPSDQYALETHIRSRGLNPDSVLIEVKPGEDGLIETQTICEAIATHVDSLALVLMSGLNYYTGQVYDMAAITQVAHAHNLLVGFDLAHAIGNVPVQLHDWGVDFATWCSYKYLNGGPGAVSGVFVHERHHTADVPRLAGWWGYDEANRFKMTKGFVPMPGAAGWQLSTPNIMGLALHKAAIDITAEAGMAALRQKSEQLTGYLAYVLQPFGEAIQVLTPADPAGRGCQLSLLVKQEGKALFNYLTESGIIGDWREPDCIRLAPTPLYNSFSDVWQVGEALRSFFAGRRIAERRIAGS
ncbi:kynureninase [Rudanella lutea]|uniref:kynureninase n=1 Tax=Rudanella lutea TaxID=451374 RepID=UPI00036236C1|nr:kynureninase [Rudanella lutea]